MEIIKDKLQRHEYRSMSQLSKDFYELLNNGRTVTSPDTLTWSDSMQLAELYEELKERSMVKTLPEHRNSYYKDLKELGEMGGGGGIRVFKDDAHASSSSTSFSSSSYSYSPSTYSSDACRMLCGYCNIPHRVTGWPSLAVTEAATLTLTARTTNDRRSSNRNETKSIKSKAVEKSRQSNNAKRKKTEKYVLSSEDEKLPYSWAIHQMLKSTDTVFTRSEGPNLMRIPMERREATEKKWAAEWDKAVAFLKKKEKEGKYDGTSDLDNSTLSGDTEHSESSFRWLCPACIHPPTAPMRDAHSSQRILRPPPSFLLNRVVKVWWLDDEMYYRGTVNAFDETAGEESALSDRDYSPPLPITSHISQHSSSSLIITPPLTLLYPLRPTRQAQSPI